MIPQSHSWALVQITLKVKDTWSPMFITVAKTHKQPKCPLTDGQVKQMWWNVTHP